MPKHRPATMPAWPHAPRAPRASNAALDTPTNQRDAAQLVAPRMGRRDLEDQLAVQGRAPLSEGAAGVTRWKQRRVLDVRRTGLRRYQRSF